MSDLKRTDTSLTRSDQSTRTPRTAAATAGRMRASEERLARKLAERGWVCFPPDYPLIGQARELREFIESDGVTAIPVEANSAYHVTARLTK